MLRQIAHALPNVDLIAEPWTAAGGYCLGAFPDGWAEWNDVARERLRMACNPRRLADLHPWMVADVVSGSAGLSVVAHRQWFAPSASTAGALVRINYLCSHDGFTLRDLRCEWL